MSNVKRQKQQTSIKLRQLSIVKLHHSTNSTNLPEIGHTLLQCLQRVAVSVLPLQCFRVPDVAFRVVGIDGNAFFRALFRFRPLAQPAVGRLKKNKILIQESKCRRNTLECFRKFETKFKKNGLGRKEETVFETIVDHIETILKPYCNIVKHCPRVRMHSTKCPLPIRWSSRSPSSAAVATIAGLFGTRQWLVRSVFLCNACCPVL